MIGLVAFVAGSIMTGTMASAAPPENNPGQPFGAILDAIAAIPAPDKERVSVTTTFGPEDFMNSGSGEFIVVLDTTGSGTLSVVHVALTTGCDIANTNNAASVGNSKPDLSVLAGVADVTNFAGIGVVINSAAEDTGFRGPGPGTQCIFHGTLTAAELGGPITDVIIGGAGVGGVNLGRTTVTVTGTYT